ncbi:alpha/beta fold hydrolase [Aestuariibius insulae]|uniref:alpha/beta fold hydrolase n=1 Tax=Aestuariibius insulae TaxID=2058287 RepID=UPI00345F0B1C
MWTLDQQHETSAGTVAAGRTGHGPDLVLAHGWPWSSFAWHRIIPALAERYRVHWYDMPGFGRSQMGGPRSASIDVQGEVFGEMLDAWELERPLVVAHDFGGAVTLRSHLLHGRDFAGWILMNVVAMRPWGSEFFDHVGRHVDAFTGLPPHIHAALVNAYIGGALAHEIDPGDRAQLAAPWLSETGKDAFYAQFAMADERYTAEVEPDFDKARCPVRILWGKDDPWIPLSRGKALASAMGADLTELPGLGHLPQLEDPATVERTLRDALEDM